MEIYGRPRKARARADALDAGRERQRARHFRRHAHSGRIRHRRKSGNRHIRAQIVFRGRGAAGKRKSPPQTLARESRGKGKLQTQCRKVGCGARRRGRRGNAARDILSRKPHGLPGRRVFAARGNRAQAVAQKQNIAVLFRPDKAPAFQPRRTARRRGLLPGRLPRQARARGNQRAVDYGGIPRSRRNVFCQARPDGAKAARKAAQDRREVREVRDKSLAVRDRARVAAGGRPAARRPPRMEGRAGGKTTTHSALQANPPCGICANPSPTYSRRFPISED